MIKVVDIVYHSHSEYQFPGEVLRKHHPTLGFLPFIKDDVDYTVIRHLAYEGLDTWDGVRYAFFNRPNRPWQIPVTTHRYIKSINPDIVLVHGFVFPLQVIALKMLLGKKCAIVLQHHAEQPMRSVRKIFQSMADRCISAYLFTAQEIAAPWLKQKVINNGAKVKTLLAASVLAVNKDKTSCKQQLCITGTHNFLWVGRLNENKDPLTVLKAFAEKINRHASARLYMIYQTAELLPQVETLIAELQLGNYVVLVGEVPNEDISTWLHAADYFVSASHSEAAGYALLEAMSAGCIPVVSRIPSYTIILENAPAYMFQPGNVMELGQVLINLACTDTRKQSAEVKNFFRQHLSFEKVAEKMLELFKELHAVQR